MGSLWATPLLMKRAFYKQQGDQRANKPPLYSDWTRRKQPTIFSTGMKIPRPVWHQHGVCMHWKPRIDCLSQIHLNYPRLLLHHLQLLWQRASVRGTLLPSALIWLPFAQVRGVSLSVTYSSRSDRDKEPHYGPSSRICFSLWELLGLQCLWSSISYLSSFWLAVQTTKLFLKQPKW